MKTDFLYRLYLFYLGLLSWLFNISMILLTLNFPSAAKSGPLLKGAVYSGQQILKSFF